MNQVFKAAERGEVERAIEIGVQTLVHAAVEKMSDRRQPDRPGPPGRRQGHRVRVERPEAVDAEIVHAEPSKHRTK